MTETRQATGKAGDVATLRRRPTLRGAAMKRYLATLAPWLEVTAMLALVAVLALA